MLICQVAKEKYLVDRIIARVNNPRNRQHFELLGIKPVRLGDRPDPAADRARGARVRAGPPARPARGAARDHRDAAAARTRRPRGQRVGDLEMPEGSLLISVLRDGARLRAQRRHGARGRRRDPRRARPGRRGGADRASSGPTAAERRRRVARCERRLPADRRRDGRPPTAPRSCASGARRARSCWSGASRSRRTSARRCRRSTCAGEAEREDAYVNPRRLVRGERRRAADAARNVMSLDAEARTAKLQGGEEVGFEQGAARDGRDGQHPARRGRRARGDPLPARVRQLRRDPRGGASGRAGGADRRQLHRLRGGGVADREGRRSARS